MDLDAVVQRMVEAPSKPDDQVSTAQKQTTRISTFVSQTVTTIITARTNALGHITSGVSELPSSSSVSSPGRPAVSSQSAVAGEEHWPIAPSLAVDGQMQLLMMLVVLGMMLVALLIRRRGMVDRKRQEGKQEDLQDLVY
jgi:hypothetical protein